MKIKLRKVPRGELFTAFGEEFVLLDHIGNGVLVIRRDIWKKAPFDTDCNNDLGEASICQWLDEYVALLNSRGAEFGGDIYPTNIDLKATDGDRAYGDYENDAVLLTLEQYGAYKHLIPKVDGAWWLATPLWAHSLRSRSANGTTSAWLVDASRGYYVAGCSSSYGVRPVLTFNSCLVVSWDGGAGEEDSTDSEYEAEWSSYLEYLKIWMDDNANTSECYGNSPLTFDEWQEEQGDEQ